MQKLPELTDFETCLHECFGVTLIDNAVYPLELIEASALPRSTANAPRALPFQLKFRGPGPGYLPQQIHRLHNDRLGPCELFLVPIGRAGDGFLYQAIFN
jgi:hypothetical protein